MATIKHICGVRVKLVRTHDSKQCVGCYFDDKRNPKTNRCKAFNQCFDFIDSEKGKRAEHPTDAFHWELSTK